MPKIPGTFEIPAIKGPLLGIRKHRTLKQLGTGIVIYSVFNVFQSFTAVIVFFLAEINASYMKKIMVVDDEIDLLALAKGYLKKAGYDVAVTTSCKEATDILASFKPNLIFLDINVGSEDGREMCKQIKSIAEHKQIPIVLISANEDLLNTYQQYDADSILKKPFQPVQLLTIATSYLCPDLRA